MVAESIAIPRRRRGVKIESDLGAFTFDATTSETLTLRTNVTSFAVEDGRTISDHAHNEPGELAISGVIVDQLVDEDDPNPNRLDEQFSLLVALRTARQPLEVFATTGRFENALITSIVARFSKEGGKIFSIELTLKEVIVARVEFTDVPPEIQVEDPKLRLELEQKQLAATQAELERRGLLAQQSQTRKERELKLTDTRRVLRSRIFDNPELDEDEKRGYLEQLQGDPATADLFPELTPLRF